MDPQSDPKAGVLAAFSRRRLLGGGLIGAAALGLGGVGISLQPTLRGAAPSEELRVLSLDEHAIVAALARRICPQPAPDVPGADAIGVGLLVE